MAEVSLKINGKSYGIACDDGQEPRLMELGRFIDTRLREIASAGAAGNEMHLMILSALMTADELFDLRDQVNALQIQVRRAERLSAAPTQAPAINEAAVAEVIEEMADHIDSITERIAKS